MASLFDPLYLLLRTPYLMAHLCAHAPICMSILFIPTNPSHACSLLAHKLMIGIGCLGHIINLISCQQAAQLQLSTAENACNNSDFCFLHYSGYIPNRPIPANTDPPYYESVMGGFTLHPSVFEMMVELQELWKVRLWPCKISFGMFASVQAAWLVTCKLASRQ